MSIASEITRLQTAKADLKTAIEGKGVTVPSSALLDDYADLVDSISGGTPVIGLVDTIEITSPVATISYTVPQLARDYGILWLVFDDVGMAYTDYVYFSVVNADASLTDNNGFYNSPATINKNCVCVFKPDMTIGNETLNGFSGTCWVGNTPSSNRIIAQSNPTVLKSKLYNANNTFTRGSIKIYGRTA